MGLEQGKEDSKRQGKNKNKEYKKLKTNKSFKKYIYILLHLGKKGRDTEKGQVTDTEARMKMHRDVEEMARHSQRQVREEKRDQRKGRQKPQDMDTNTKEDRNEGQDALALLGGWAPFCTGTEKGGLTKGSG